ncbi:toxin-antitoxin system antitoxin subunit, partial [Listeria monocytogenes]|nr:toxin-antitoxin system antitoxin subunit [Listeria monocytogenes]
MTTITFRVSDKEKAFIQEMAKLNGISISELSRKKIIEGLEDQIDLQSYERAIKAHQVKDES